MSWSARPGPPQLLQQPHGLSRQQRVEGGPLARDPEGSPCCDGTTCLQLGEGRYLEARCNQRADQQDAGARSLLRPGPVCHPAAAFQSGRVLAQPPSIGVSVCRATQGRLRQGGPRVQGAWQAVPLAVIGRCGGSDSCRCITDSYVVDLCVLRIVRVVGVGSDRFINLVTQLWGDPGIDHGL